MLGHYGFSGFVGKYVHVFCKYCHGPFKYWNRSGNGVRSLHQFKFKKSVQLVKGKKAGKSVKSRVSAEDKNPKVYMRDTIGNISKILRYSTWDLAQEQLENLTIRWDSYTINQVLKTHPPMEKAWLFFNWASHLKGFKHDQYTYTTMLDIFGEAGRISSMKFVFQQMQEKGIKKDAVTYTSLLHWLSKDGDVNGSLRMWEEMKAAGCRPTVVSYTALMKVLFDNNRPKEATDIYKEMLQSGCSPNCYTYTILMEYLARTGKFKAALDILSKMQDAGVQPDKATCNILVQKCSIAGETRAMAQILLYMKESSIVLHRPVYLEALKTLENAGEATDLLRKVNPHLSFERIGKEGIFESEATVVDVNSFLDTGLAINLLAKHNFVAVEYLLNEIICRNVQFDSMVVSTIVQVSCANCRPTTALLAFRYSLKMGLEVERAAYLALIGLFFRTKSFLNALEVVEQMIGVRFFFGTYLVSLLVNQFGSAKMSATAAKIFHSLPDDQNLVTYTALMRAYFCYGDVDKGLEIYETMKNKGICVSLGTYNVLVIGLEDSGRVQEAETYRKAMKKIRYDGHSQNKFPMEASLCDLLFARGAVS
ncbi:pentatricopeptide repeat-containing protein At2g01390 [Macadamia integrifolia]|uniref:pentatricopeptide repeat-containing protein At2g01390 n=1 Tax=Macadamia integrifolia TaxID=60698 RepID=UPI001C4FFEC1|nr:pentatricopeptide repeat-containing protein At2g01390 [Macadamia integrifolia]XP_042509025.1 pentatricopeptide repeat-containing protein At2g01390 [Macadamia integrifolia]XP_042509026.1 pentatricopeptide repeat-containing protein At2g01390 [Macadamia integrifolia]XP_042509027.1 pentatricopeptide repeat-containing protein At2g01390 [Macadamia integrifolia]XP_042509028.1 pentatricopeptide repeat-containing protein At2g01390 [Macadamia integrifolia]XP_042509029.1 pentatricopeptide repeat-conta